MWQLRVWNFMTLGDSMYYDFLIFFKTFFWGGGGIAWQEKWILVVNFISSHFVEKLTHTEIALSFYIVLLNVVGHIINKEILLWMHTISQLH